MKFFVKNKFISFSLILFLFLSCSDNPTQVNSIDNSTEKLNLNNQELDANEENAIQSQSSNCKDVKVGVAYGENGYRIDDIKIEICEQDSSGDVNPRYSIGEALIHSVFYQPNTVDFPTASFHTEWTNDTEWLYISGTESGISENPSTSTTFAINNETVGSDHVVMYNLKLNKSSNSSAPTTPSLISPSDNEDVSKNNIRLNWQASDGNPTPEYKVNIYNNDSYNQTFTTSNTGYYLTLSVGKYNWRVKATNSAGSSSWSSTRSFNAAPNPPSIVNKDYEYDNNYNGHLPKITWSAVSDADFYEIEITNNLTSSTAIATTSNTEYNPLPSFNVWVDPSFHGHEDFMFRVRSVTNTGTGTARGNFSNAVTYSKDPSFY